MGVLQALAMFLRVWLVPRVELVAENLALRQQVAVLKHSTKRPKLRPRDRVFWTLLMRIWPDWRSVLIMVKPETVIHWHRRGFKLYWRWKSSGSPGRPTIDAAVRALIRQISKENPTFVNDAFMLSRAHSSGPHRDSARSNST